MDQVLTSVNIQRLPANDDLTVTHSSSIMQQQHDNSNHPTATSSTSYSGGTGSTAGANYSAWPPSGTAPSYYNQQAAPLGFYRPPFVPPFITPHHPYNFYGGLQTTTSFGQVDYCAPTGPSPYSGCWPTQPSTSPYIHSLWPEVNYGDLNGNWNSPLTPNPASAAVLRQQQSDVSSRLQFNRQDNISSQGPSLNHKQQQLSAAYYTDHTYNNTAPTIQNHGSNYTNDISSEVALPAVNKGEHTMNIVAPSTTNNSHNVGVHIVGDTPYLEAAFGALSVNNDSLNKNSSNNPGISTGSSTATSSAQWSSTATRNSFVNPNELATALSHQKFPSVVSNAPSSSCYNNFELNGGGNVSQVNSNSTTSGNPSGVPTTNKPKSWASVASQPPKGSAATIGGFNLQQAGFHASGGNNNQIPLNNASCIQQNPKQTSSNSVNANNTFKSNPTNTWNFNNIADISYKSETNKAPASGINYTTPPKQVLKSPNSQHLITSTQSNSSRTNTQVSEDSPLEAVDVKEITKNINPKQFNTNPTVAKFFVIKSYSEDDVHRSIKYSIWCSTVKGNEILDKAFKELNGSGPVYLFFSVNGSGHFCGVAEMESPVNSNSKAGVWCQEKWTGKFQVKWIFVKDVPNSQLRHIRLENNENKPVTNCRDVTEVPLERGRQVLKVIHGYRHTTSLFDDYLHYERREMSQVGALGSTVTGDVN